jgi:hypothetical protein
MRPCSADEAAQGDDGKGEREPELDHHLAAFGAPAQLAVVVASGVGPLDDPPRANLDRDGLAAPGDPSSKIAGGQLITARLVVVAGV